jgi:hypothetical protein
MYGKPLSFFIRGLVHTPHAFRTSISHHGSGTRIHVAHIGRKDTTTIIIRQEILNFALGDLELSGYQAFLRIMIGSFKVMSAFRYYN